MTTPQMRSRFWTFLSLWSLLALAAPQLLWACPMMGQVSSTPHSSNPGKKCCCAKKISTEKLPGQTTSAPADSSKAQCCNEVPVPASDTSGDSSKLALTSQRTLASSLEYFALPSTPAVLPALDILAPQSVAIAYSSTTFLSLISQHTSRLTSGRAPPF